MVDVHIPTTFCVVQRGSTLLTQNTVMNLRDVPPYDEFFYFLSDRLYEGPAWEDMPEYGIQKGETVQYRIATGIYRKVINGYADENNRFVPEPHSHVSVVILAHARYSHDGRSGIITVDRPMW